MAAAAAAAAEHEREQQALAARAADEARSWRHKEERAAVVAAAQERRVRQAEAGAAAARAVAAERARQQLDAMTAGREEAEAPPAGRLLCTPNHTFACFGDALLQTHSGLTGWLRCRLVLGAHRAALPSAAVNKSAAQLELESMLGDAPDGVLVPAAGGVYCCPLSGAGRSAAQLSVVHGAAHPFLCCGFA